MQQLKEHEVESMTWHNKTFANAFECWKHCVVEGITPPPAVLNRAAEFQEYLGE